MIFTPLASSSRGNAYILDDGDTRILIECGIPYKRLQKLLDFRTSTLDACLISHEHKDHAYCHKDIIKNGIPVYASEGTARALECEDFHTIADRETTVIGSFDVLPFATFHDAAEPLGFLIRSRKDGEKLVFATDTVNLGYQFPGVCIAAIECNYDEEILARSDRMPDKVKQRISNAHMEIKRSCAWLAKLDKTALRAVYLLHLSDACSNEAHFERDVRAVLPPGVTVTVCPK